MGQIDHVLLLAATGRPFLPRKEAALADPKHVAHPADREAGTRRWARTNGASMARSASMKPKVIDFPLSRRRRSPCLSDQWRDMANLFLRYRAPASGPHAPAATASARHEDQPVPHSARWHRIPLSAIASASTARCPDPPQSPVVSDRCSAPAAPLHAETPASVCSRFP